MSQTLLDPNADVLACPIPLLRARTVSRPGILVTRGELVVVKYGVYAPATLWRDLAPWDRYLARVHAAALTMPGLVFSHESAAVLLGLPIFGEPSDVHVLRDPTATSGSWSGLRTHTAAVPRETVIRGGLQLTSLAETTVDVARSRHRAIGLAVVDAALRSDSALRVEQLVAMNEARASSRGRRHARWSLHRGNPAAARALESISRAVVEFLGFAEPELQVPFDLDGRRYFVDCFWPDAQIVGEADGREKYGGAYGEPGRAVYDEKQREDSIRRVVKGFARWGWADVRDPTRLRRILVAAGLRPESVGDPEPLATITAALHGHRFDRETG